MWACDSALTTTAVNSYQAAGPLFVQTLQTFLAAQCALAGDHLWPADALDSVVQDPNYDFIVVGAGSAGAVVANRLSEVPNWKVLLIEAGGNPTVATETPQIFYNNIGTTEDWGYKTVPQEGACLAYKELSCAWPRGKTLGGCSSINGMFYVRANKVDYDQWAAQGNPGWSYDEVLPYFMKSENYSGKINENTHLYHGNGGYLNVQNNDDLHDFEKLLLNAIGETGIRVVDDINTDFQMGATKASTTIKDGIRHSTARAFLAPIKDRKNLHVLKNALVTKILFEPGSNVVSGILVNKNGRDIVVNANKEVVVSSGAINTPQLLLLSGIGPNEHLKLFNIDVKADLPVGENLQDHLFVPFLFSLPGTFKVDGELIANQVIEYMLNNTGPLSITSPHRVISFFNTTDRNAVSPNIQFHYLVFLPQLYKYVDYFGLHGLNTEVQEKARELNRDNILIIAYVGLLSPKSKGKIVLKSNDPNEHPLIYANYFTEHDDLNAVIEGYKQHIYELSKSKVFQTIGIKQVWIDLDACKKYEKSSDEFLECYSRHMTFSLYHPSGTAKMGPSSDESTVVDSELRVKNFENLRVIDASIMPDIVKGNTNAPVIMIAEKGADLIKKSWFNTHTEL
ncbi:hypothetical protein ACJJTC_005949 [Scirpophaga incertulas]